jgi:hypothetical protein
LLYKANSDESYCRIQRPISIKPVISMFSVKLECSTV